MQQLAEHPGGKGGLRARRGLLFAAAAYLSAAPALACPSCSLGQAIETLLYVMGFMLIPYVIVTGVLFWMRRVVALEQDGGEGDAS